MDAGIYKGNENPTAIELQIMDSINLLKLQYLLRGVRLPMPDG
jgi:hypothetical protein